MTQHVAHSLVESGHTESKAIEMAVGIVRNWSEGKGNVHPAIKAAAVKAMAEWESKRAAAHATSAAKSAAGAVKESADLHDQFVAESKRELKAITISLGPALIAEALRDGSGFMALSAEEADFGPDSLLEVDLSAAGRKAMAKAKTARADGSFPIPSVEFLHKAIKAVGRAKDPAAAKAWIKKRAKALGATKALPSSWSTAMAESELIQMAEELTGILSLCEEMPQKLSEAYNPPTWVIPKQARQPGFQPLKPPKAKTASTSSASSNTLHPHDPHSGEFLRKGGSGAAIAGVQAKLGIKTTGNFDSLTRQKVVAYQKANGLQVDGVIGAQTAASMLGKPARQPGSLPTGLRSGLKQLGTGKLHAERLEERTIHTEARQRDNGVRAASHSSIRSAVFDLADSATPTHTVKLPNGTTVKANLATRPSYGSYRQQFTVSNGKETIAASGVEEAADHAKELDSRRMRAPAGSLSVAPGLTEGFNPAEKRDSHGRWTLASIIKEIPKWSDSVLSREMDAAPPGELFKAIAAEWRKRGTPVG